MTTRGRSRASRWSGVGQGHQGGVGWSVTTRGRSGGQGGVGWSVTTEVGQGQGGVGWSVTTRGRSGGQGGVGWSVTTRGRSGASRWSGVERDNKR